MSKNLNKSLALFVVLCVAVLNSGLFSYSYNVALAASTEYEQSFALPIREQSRNHNNDVITPDTEDTQTNNQTQSVPTTGSSSKVTICHLTAGNPANAHTIEVSVNSLSAHLEHGDTMGACQAPVDHCAALMQNIKNFQGVQFNIKNNTYDPAFDLNGDDAIDLSDVIIASQAQPAADANGDGAVNLSDVVLSIQCLNSDPVHQYCSSLVQNIKNYQGVKANIQAGTNDPAFDLDHNGVIDLSDVIVATNAEPSADVNSDGIVNLTDVVLASQCNSQVVSPVLDQPQIVTPPRNDSDDVATTTPPTQQSCDALIDNMRLVQNADHSVAGDLNGDGITNLSDIVLLAQLDLGGQNGTSDGVINLTDVVLLAQRCGDFLPNPDATQPTAPALSQNNNGGGTGASYYLIPTPTITPILQPQVLGEQITECKVDKDVVNKTKFANGTLLRVCNTARVYLIKDGQKLYIEDLTTLRKKYAGKRIYNVSQNVLDLYSDWTPKVLAIKPSASNKVVKASVKVTK